MSEDIYRKLAQHLDDLPGGFPSTESGVELRILRRLFTPEEAELAIHLTMFPEESEIIITPALHCSITPNGQRLLRRNLAYL